MVVDRFLCRGGGDVIARFPSVVILEVANVLHWYVVLGNWGE